MNPTLRGEFVAPGDARWPELLEDMPHDIYQTPEYVAFAAQHQERGEPCAYVVSEATSSLLIPLIIRAIPNSTRADAISPRGFAGPVIGRRGDVVDDDFVVAALDAFDRDLHGHGLVSAFIRLHPLLSPGTDALAGHGDLVDHGDSVSIDLGRSEEELWSQMRSNHRRDIRRALKAGYTVRIDDEWEHFDEFVEAYAQSMRRLGAAPHWHLSREYFVDLREALADRLHLCVVEIEGRLAAASLASETDGIAEYHLAATRDEHVRASPSKLLIHYLTGWAQGRGNRLLHLAGSLRRDDSLNHFKIGFSPDQHPIYSWRVIADADAYAELSSTVPGRHADQPGDGDDLFPAYRRRAVNQPAPTYATLVSEPG